MIGIDLNSFTGLIANISIVIGAVAAGVGGAVAYLKNRGRNW